MQGGSSFNALVRAMKQQVVDTNTGMHDPNLLFEINNMSMNKVQVFPDGELDIQARAERSNTAAFVKPTGAAVAGRAMQSRHGGPGTGGGLAPGTPDRSGAGQSATSDTTLASASQRWQVDHMCTGEDEVKRQ